MTNNSKLTTRNSQLTSAFTLIELTIALAASSVLVAGLASSLYISSQALNENVNASQQSRTAAVVLHDLATDLNKAIEFSERTATALTFTVPDRDGDNAPEIIRYAWSGNIGDSLTYQYNGGTIVNIAADVHSFNTTALTREMVADALAAPIASGVVYEEMSSAKLASYSSSITIVKPPGTTEGDLLIAAVATDGNTTSSLVGPNGWNLITIGPTGMLSYQIKQTFGVWWKLASASEPNSYQFNGVSGVEAYGWIMRFTGHDPTNPISAFTSDGGKALPLAIPSPAVTSTLDNTMILRLAGFDGSGVTPGVPGLLLPLHTPITMDKSSTNNSSAASGGAGYLIQATAGDSGNSSFTLVGLFNEEYTSVTIAIAPEVDP